MVKDPGRHRLEIAELCSGSTGDFESLSPGSNPGSAAFSGFNEGITVVKKRVTK